MSENNKTPYMKIYASEIAEKLIYHELWYKTKAVCIGHRRIILIRNGWFPFMEPKTDQLTVCTCTQLNGRRPKLRPALLLKAWDVWIHECCRGFGSWVKPAPENPLKCTKMDWNYPYGNIRVAITDLQYWPKVTQAKKRASHVGCNACNARIQRVSHRICYSNVAHMKRVLNRVCYSNVAHIKRASSVHHPRNIRTTFA
jgi:hypothetical protein